MNFQRNRYDLRSTPTLQSVKSCRMALAATRCIVRVELRRGVPSFLRPGDGTAQALSRGVQKTLISFRRLP